MSQILLLTALLILGLLAFRRRPQQQRLPAKRITAAVAGLLGALAATLAGLFAAGVEAGETDDDSDSAPSGGVLNYRTGKLDDGTDPVGWYEED